MSDDNAAPVFLHQQSHPRQAYRIVMTIENPPGPFAQVEGSARYYVVNYQACGELSRIPGAEGVASRIDNQPEVSMERLSENTYAATVYADLMIDEDYYGRGTCHWKFKYFSALLRATGDLKETRYLPYIEAEDIFSGRQVSWHFWKGYYPRANSDDFSDNGQEDLSAVPIEKRNEFFQVTLYAHEVQL